MSYFALGAYYNYSTYGATGLDLIPWVPFLTESPFASNADACIVLLGTETSGEKFHTCFAMSWIISVHHFDRGTVAEADILSYEPAAKSGEGGGMYSTLALLARRFACLEAHQFFLDYCSVPVCTHKAVINHVYKGEFLVVFS